MDAIVNYLTIGDETREIADSQSREDIELLKTQVEENRANIEYIATIMNIDLSQK